MKSRLPSKCVLYLLLTVQRSVLANSTPPILQILATPIRRDSRNRLDSEYDLFMDDSLMEADSLGGRVSRYICAPLAVVVVEVVSLWRRFAGSFMMDLVLGYCGFTE